MLRPDQANGVAHARLSCKAELQSGPCLSPPPGKTEGG